VAVANRRAERAAFICEHVFEKTRPVLLVSHEENGDWQFLCGEFHDDGELPLVAGINHMWEDPTLRELMDLPEHFEAQRAAVGEAWMRTSVTDGEH
jgi:hypothetical protein